MAAPTLEMCAQCGSTISASRPIIDDASPYPYGRTRLVPKISTPDYIETGDSHNHTSRSSESYRPIKLIPLHSRPNGNCTGKLRVWV